MVCGPVVGPGFITSYKFKQEGFSKCLIIKEGLESRQIPDILDSGEVCLQLVPQGNYMTRIIFGGVKILIEVVGFLKTFREEIEHACIDIP